MNLRLTGSASRRPKLRSRNLCRIQSLRSAECAHISAESCLKSCIACSTLRSVFTVLRRKKCPAHVLGYTQSDLLHFDCFLYVCKPTPTDVCLCVLILKQQQDQAAAAAAGLNLMMSFCAIRPCALLPTWSRDDLSRCSTPLIHSPQFITHLSTKNADR